MPMIVVDNGLEDAKAAELGGFLVSLAEFSVTEAKDFEITSDRSGLVGEERFRGTIQSIEALNLSTVKLTCTIPKDKPIEGQWDLAEVAIWNSNGRMFAHGSFPPFPKTGEYGLKFYIYVTLARLGDVINITNSDTYSLPSAARVASLQPPETASQNTVVVMDSNSHLQEVANGLPADSSSPAVAVKFGAEGDVWGFTNHSRVFTGTVDKVSGLSSFTLSPGANGFWLADDEIVIVSVVAGAGKGQSRKMRFNLSAKSFTTVDAPFKNFDVNSRIMLWRSHEAALPKRHAGIPDYYVLAHGNNTYETTTVSVTPSRLESYLHVFTGTGVDGYTIPETSLPMSRVQDSTFLIVQPENGPILKPSEYVMVGNQLRIVAKLENGRRCRVWAFARSTNGAGGSTRFVDTAFDSTGDAEYSLGSVPKDANSVFVQDSGGTVYSSGDFAIIGNRIVFANGKVPPAGRKLLISQAGVALSDAQRGAMTRTFLTTAGSTREVMLPRLVADKSSLILMVNGQIVASNRYSLAGNKITTIDTIPAGAFVDVMVFWYEDTVSVSARGGEDTGPRWIDPAGEEGMPNKLIPGRVSYIAGVTTKSPSYPVDTVPDANHLIVFVRNNYFPPTEYSFDGTQVWPKELIPEGDKIEIFCFRSVESPGSVAKPLLTNVHTSGTRSVTIHKNANTQSLIVTLGRNYKHHDEYTYNAATGVLTFKEDVAADVNVMAWSYADQEQAGYQVKMFSTLQAFTPGVTKYLMQGTLTAKQDMIPFMEGELQGYDSWNLTTTSGLSYQDFIFTQPGWAGKQMQAVEFSSRKPQRRLALRSDLDGFLSKDANLADVPDKEEARRNLGVVEASDIPDVSVFLRKDANLADVVNKATARQNLGITDIINQMMQNVLLRNNNLSDIPNKAQARANLGIPEIGDLGIDFGAAFDVSINTKSWWWAKIGRLHVRGGHFEMPTNQREGTRIVIPFMKPFPSVTMSVIFSDVNPDGRNNHDAVGQLSGGYHPVGSFTVFVNEPGDASANWRGCHYIAFGY